MNAERSRQTHYGAARSYVTQLARNFSQHRKWVRCPKCIGGNMYREINGEYTCLQCGCSYYPDTVTGTSKLGDDCLSEAEKRTDEFHLAVSH